MITRTEFESWPVAKQKKYANVMYPKVRKEVLTDCADSGRFRDATGSLIVDTHHCWARAHCSYWWYFQAANLLPISHEAHYAIHNIPKENYSEAIKIMADKAETIKQAVLDAERGYVKNTINR